MAGPALLTEVIEDSARLTALRGAWMALEAAAPDNPFLGWDWQTAWWEAFGAGLTLRALAVWDGDQLRGIWPLYLDPARPGELRVLGGLDVTDHLGFLSTTEWAPAVAAAGLGWLAAGAVGRDGHRLPGPVLDLHFIPADGAVAAAIQAAAAGQQCTVEAQAEAVSPWVPLAASFEEWVQTRLSKKDRHELRRKRRRLDAEHPGWRLRCYSDQGWEPALERFFELHRLSTADKAAFWTDEIERFFRLVGARLAATGRLRLHLLETGDGAVAATLGFVVGGCWYLYNSGYDPAASRWSVGLLCVAEGVRLAIEEGCERADFLRGSEPYKYDLGGVDRSLIHLRVTPAGTARDDERRA